jgi:hypothetical protein
VVSRAGQDLQRTGAVLASTHRDSKGFLEPTWNSSCGRRLTRQQHSRTVIRYQTDLTDAEGRLIAPHFNRSQPVYAKYIEHVPPDVTAGIFWMKNPSRNENLALIETRCILKLSDPLRLTFHIPFWRIDCKIHQGHSPSR